MTIRIRQPKKKLTPRQKQILIYVAKHIDRHGWQPSIRDIGAEFGISSPNGVVCHLKAMAHKGYLSFNEATARALEFDWKSFVNQKV